MGIAQSAHRWIASGIVLAVLKYAMDKVLSIQVAFAKIKDYPGRGVLWMRALSVGTIVLGTTFPRPGMAGYYAAKFFFYKKFGATSFATIRIWAAQQIFWFADAEAAKQIGADRFTFQKDVAEYELINIYGKNLVSADESDWKRHRSVAMSAFNETNVALVWSETLRVMDEWFQELDAADTEHTLNMMHPMKQATLLVIASAGFGRRVSWAADSTTKPPPGCKLTFRSAVITSVENVIFRVLFPDWAFWLLSAIKVPYLSSRAVLARLAFDDLRIHMLDLVASARAESVSEEHSDASGAALLRNVVEANIKQGSDLKKLTENEMLSNIFAFLLAGHETSSHSLCFAFVLLALHPECQQKVYEEVTRVWPADAPLSLLITNHKEHMDKLEYTMAFIRETLRLFPAEPRIGKCVHKDAVLPGTYFTPGSRNHPSIKTSKFSMAIPAGSFVVMDVWAVHMNTLYWGEDPAQFRPERFIDTSSYQWPRNAFLPFSAGARSCIDDLVNKPFEVQKEALLKWQTGITLTPANPRVKLRLRV